MSTHYQNHLCTMKQEQGKRTDSRELDLQGRQILELPSPEYNVRVLALIYRNERIENMIKNKNICKCTNQNL